MKEFQPIHTSNDFEEEDVELFNSVTSVEVEAVEAVISDG